jgi:hypothetical protein
VLHSELVTGGSQITLGGGGSLVLNSWAHVAATYDGSMLRVYLNGTEVASQPRTGAIDTSTGPLRIGGNSIWPGEFFNGLVDDVRVYSRALTAEEIQVDMNTPVGP